MAGPTIAALYAHPAMFAVAQRIVSSLTKRGEPATCCSSRRSLSWTDQAISRYWSE